MSFSKLQKYLQKPIVPPTGSKILTPFLISDSKGFDLERQIADTISTNIKWRSKSGRTASQSLDWIQQNLSYTLGRFDNISLYIWIGTCDLTSYDGRYISLRSETTSSVENITKNFEEIVQIFNQYPGCKLTFLELPAYSIHEYNKKKGHTTPNIFIEQDESLLHQIHSVNTYIRQLNSRIGSKSPNFCQDISHNKEKTSKNKHIRLRDRYNFTLYRDGEHPSSTLAKVWLKKICSKIKEDCWSN